MAKEFYRLIQQYLDNSLTGEEWERLKQMLREDSYRALLDESVERTLRESMLQDERGMHNIKEKIFAAIAGKIDAPVIEKESTIDRRSGMLLSPWVKFGIAACLVLAVSTVALFLMQPAAPPSSPLAAGQNNASVIQPGSDRAILTLADGSQVSLDNETRGDVATQADVRVIQLQPGRLSYQGHGSSKEVLYNTISTPRGGQYQVILPDGSSVWLNASSSLRFPTAFNQGTREVFLTGQAFFQVKPNKNKPFIVQASKLSVEVLGTSFDIMAYTDEDELNTTLVEGSVKVKESGDITLLKPGQQASKPSGDKKMAVKNVNVDEVTAWKDGRFYFGSTSVYYIMRQIQRWYDVEIEYKGDVSAIQLAGVISRKKNMKDLLEALEATGEIAFQLEGRKVQVLPGAIKH